MGKINWTRIVLGGLLAGVVITLVGLGFSVFLGGDLKRVVQAARPLHTRAQALAFFIPVYFVGGILAVWWYAAIRPRFSPGPKTAAVAGFAVWLTQGPAQFLVGYFAQLPSGVLVAWMGATLLQLVAGTLAGAWAYKE